MVDRYAPVVSLELFAELGHMYKCFSKFALDCGALHRFLVDDEIVCAQGMRTIESVRSIGRRIKLCSMRPLQSGSTLALSK